MANKQKYKVGDLLKISEDGWYLDSSNFCERRIFFSVLLEQFGTKTWLMFSLRTYEISLHSLERNYCTKIEIIA